MARTRRGKPINGWLCIDKGQGMTSTQAVAVVKRLTGAQKVGHGGTLDPLATGILPMAMGEATKTVAYVMDAAKAYRFTVRFGAATDTDDSEGAIVATSDERPADADILAALHEFTGVIQQRPPSYAAVKIDGERAYDIARRGDKVELETREVRIDALAMIERPDADHASFEMVSGKGAYVRAIARDLGERLGCLAHVTALRRTEVGSFTTGNAVSLEGLAAIVADDALPQILVPLATALAGIPALAVTGPQAQRLRSGQPIIVSPQLLADAAAEGATVRAMESGHVVALGRLDGMEFSPLRVFNL